MFRPKRFNHIIVNGELRLSVRSLQTMLQASQSYQSQLDRIYAVILNARFGSENGFKLLKVPCRSLYRIILLFYRGVLGLEGGSVNEKHPILIILLMMFQKLVVKKIVWLQNIIMEIFIQFLNKC